MKLWQKTGSKIHPAVNKYIISKNLEADNALLPYDIQGSIAQANMLERIGILMPQERDDLIQGLNEILKAHKKGEFLIDQENEDVHTAIENYLVEKYGNTGKKIHTGRSRNDQVLTAQRLQSKDKIKETIEAAKKIAQTILKFSQAHEFVPMPGYTHTQIAMPSSVGQWSSSFVESLINDIHALEGVHKIIDQNPLGTAAGFGSMIPNDRNFTTKELEFSQIQINPIYAQNSRGKLEAFVLAGLMQVMLTLGKIAHDLVWFSSTEIKFFDINPALMTGSSIMPQKKNLDIMEVLRANVHVVQAHMFQVQSVGMNLISGYNKDLKIIKKPVLESFQITLDSLAITQILFENMQPNKERLLDSFDDSIFATDASHNLVLSGMSFRDAYQQIGENLDQVKAVDPLENIKSKTHIGSTGNLGLEKLQERLESVS